jgi:aminoglycoside phosphotransferase (APT) family kinase protein
VEITGELVERLVGDQHPDLADRGLRLFGSGWDNTTYRLGADLAVRLPRRQLGADMMVKEHQWLPDLAPRLPLPTGAPVRVGEPGHGYPWPWSIVEWVDGVSAEVVPPDASEAAQMGAFLRALHTPSPPDAPISQWRGGVLADRSFSVKQRIDRLGAEDVDVPLTRLTEAWMRTNTVPPYVGEPVWLHGDLHPRNIIVNDGRIAGIIDWGDLCAGDPATDLAAAWMLFPSRVHPDLRDAYGPVSAETWERARGWAIFFGAIMVDTGRKDDALWAECGRIALSRACS